jgi:hypothetical protein
MSKEREYYDALKVISQYQSVEWLRKSSDRAYGLPYPEALEFAYEKAIIYLTYLDSDRLLPCGLSLGYSLVDSGKCGGR